MAKGVFARCSLLITLKTFLFAHLEMHFPGHSRAGDGKKSCKDLSPVP